MVKPEWGLKRTCPGCGSRFYDLLRDPITCPDCGATVDPAALMKPRRSRPAAKAVAEVDKSGGAAAATQDDDDVVETMDDDDDEDDKDIIEDASELGEDEDDVSEVVEGVDDDDDSDDR